MNPTVVGAVVIASTLSGALLGMWLRSALPENHLNADSRDTVKVGVGLIATMTALVLGLVTASAKNSFDAVNTAIVQNSIEILALDRVLARYGPETGEIRSGLKRAIGDRIETIWPQGSNKPTNLDPILSTAVPKTEGLADIIRGLQPRDDAQRMLQSRALGLAETLLQARWLVLVGTETSVPMPFLVILLFWLTITFMSFGLFAPFNATVLTVLLVCAVSVGSAVFLVLEMDSSFDGLIRVSPDPLRYAYEHLNL